MRKLSLNLDDLQVDSFATHAGELPQNGTVRGYLTEGTCSVQPSPVTVRKTVDATCPITCDDYTCLSGCAGTSCFMPVCNTCDSCAGHACEIPETSNCTS